MSTEDNTVRTCALRLAEASQREAKALGFDWQSAEPVFEKVLEELDELKEAVAKKQRVDIEEELGDLLFTVVNLSRHLEICPQRALLEANTKFIRRFDRVKALADARNINMNTSNIVMLEALWSEIKSR